MTFPDGVVLVIGSGRRPYRDYLLSSASARHPLWLFDDTEPTWQRGHVRGVTVVDTGDRAAAIGAARTLATTTPVVGVLTWDETLVVTAAHVAAALGLPGAGTNAIQVCRDKYLSRRLLSDAGIPQPRFRFVRHEKAAVEAAERIGHPVVVKPRGLGASIGVQLAEDADEVRHAFGAAHRLGRAGEPSSRGGALVEEYLTGPEISVDGAVVDGEYLPLFVARKTVAMHPFFEELGHVVDPADELLHDRWLLTTLVEAHRAIGFRSGVTHTEVKLTERGPVIVEINGRLGGDLIPRLARLANCIEPGAVAVDVALGRRPRLPWVTGGPCVGIRFCYPPEDCVVESVSVPQPADADGILAAAALVSPGTELLLPPHGFISRHAYVICAGRDRADCAARLDSAAAAVALDARPLRLAGTAAVG